MVGLLQCPLRTGAHKLRPGLLVLTVGAAYAGADIDPKMGPGPAVGSAGGFVDAGQAALTGQPVVGPGFGPGAVNATPGAL